MAKLILVGVITGIVLGSVGFLFGSSATMFAWKYACNPQSKYYYASPGAKVDPQYKELCEAK